jgi:hypothetical protein
MAMSIALVAILVLKCPPVKRGMTIMDSDYSKAALMRFLSFTVEHGLLNQNTAAGWSAACTRILEDVADGDDVRGVEPATAIKRYHNKHPGELKGTVLKEYERRLTRALIDFVKYTEDPTSYKGRGRGPTPDGTGKPKPRNSKAQTTAEPQKAAPANAVNIASTVGALTGLSYDFPIRPGFLAQVVVPRDMKVDEARRLARFVMALAVDNEVKGGEF